MDGLAHDLRNPLNALALNVEVLQEKLSRASGGEVPAGPAKNLQALRDQVARLDALLREVATVLGHTARRAQVLLELEAPEGDRVQAPDPSLLRFLVLRTVLRAVDRTPPGGRVRLSVGREGGRPILLVEDGELVREPASPALEEGLAALARTQLAELHQGPRLRLVFTGA